MSGAAGEAIRAAGPYERMRVLTTPGGELATVFGPLCDNTACGCDGHAVGLDSAHGVETVTVAERDGFTLADLRSACSALLERTGWADDDGELAEMMSEEAADVAEQCEPGTQLWPRFDRVTGEWNWFDEDPAPLTASV